MRLAEERPGALEQVARPLVRGQVFDLLYELLVWGRLGLVRPPLSFQALPFLLYALELDNLLLSQGGGTIPRFLLGPHLQSGRFLLGRWAWRELSRELRPRVGVFERLG